jgi:glutathione S-transferase
MTRLYHTPGSRSTRVLWTLEEIGIPYEVSTLTRKQRTGDEHRRLHPLGRVPVLELDGGTPLFESAAICLQLADMNPQAGLIPALGSVERGLVYQWTLFAMTEVEKAAFPWLRAHRAGEDETGHIASFSPVGDALRQGLAGHEWITGDTFTVADILLASMLRSPVRIGLLAEADPLANYTERALARPANRRAEAIDE